MNLTSMYKIILPLLIISFMNTQERPTLIYIGDPMCSWCYGIAPELDKVKTHFKDQINYEVVLGGLRPYNTQSMIELKSFLTDHWKHVHAASNQPFNYDILNSTDITYDTEPPCRAVVAVRQIDASKALSFFKETQSAFYRDNKNMHLVESYFDALEKVRIGKKEFTDLFISKQLKSDVKKDFLKASQLGVNSFPTIILKNGEEYTIVAKGYAKAEEMIKKIEKLR